VRNCWLRTLLVLQRPRPVFVALRDESADSVGDRSEPILLIVILAGIAAVLMTSTAAHLMDDSSYDATVTAIWVFLVGSLQGFTAYFVIGWFLYRGARAVGSQGTYRRARHVFAFACVPVALSLVLWPVKLSLYGSDWFRTGGRDTGLGGGIFDLLTYAFFAWALVLLVVGVRSVHGWTWARALAAIGIAVAGMTLTALVVWALALVVGHG
jgi:hypothetical protein